MRRMVVELAQSASGDSAQRAERAVQVLTQLGRSHFRYFANNPATLAALEAYERDSGNYLAHEFMNDTWQPYYSIDVADSMQALGLAYVGSATLPDNHPLLVIDAVAAEAIAKLPTARQRTLATDFAVDRRFRRDVYVRGAHTLGAAEALAVLNATTIGCTTVPTRLSAKTTVPRGELNYREDFMVALRALLAAGSYTIGDAVAALGGSERNPAEITRNLIFLVAAGVLTPFARAQRTPASSLTPHRCLARGLAHVLDRGTMRPLPAEILGGGFEIHPSDALAIQEWLGGARDATALTSRLRDRLANPQAAAATAKQTIDELVPTLQRVGLLVP